MISLKVCLFQQYHKSEPGKGAYKFRTFKTGKLDIQQEENQG
ncbi:hypothetical protein ERICV_02949 [Paenibacillus larvae subsp. larvae]|uniref:Uncharacterized protein n=1 Tax=Paenibacillus larvae subsp. larvae TaxID=147375 RepID=A0A6C0QUM2_9BACL|nr:hypothetical protein ERICV_02949 [Paenibacillus larvae subsp. larvae]